MTSRERINMVINHKVPDRVPLDLGATSQTGINASTLYKFRKELGLDEHPIQIDEPAQMLGHVDEDLMKKVGADVIGLWNPSNVFGVKNKDFVPFTMDDGTPCSIAKKLNWKKDKNGVTYGYPQGDTNEAPSMKMPENGYFFDNIDRGGGEYDEDNLNAIEDYKNDFSIMTDEEARYIEKKSYDLHNNTEYGIIGMLGGGSFGDVFMLPGCFLKGQPHGIRKMEDWLVAHLLFPEYIEDLFGYQSEIALKNFEIYRQAVGNRIQILWVSGSDYGTQKGPFTSVDVYCQLYKPFQKKLNDWIHKNTEWKTFYHSCGGIDPLIPHLIEAGVDILNPVQCSAANMEAEHLKEAYGDDIVFWGGGIDTQWTLPFGTPQEVYDQALSRIKILGKDGGYVFSSIHNIVGGVPAENLEAFYRAYNDYVKSIK